LADSLTTVVSAQVKNASSSNVVSRRCSTRSAAGAKRALSSIGGRMHNLLARQMIGQRLALRLGVLADRRRGSRRFGFCDFFGLSGFQFLKPQFELLDLATDALRRPAKLHPAQLGNLELELEQNRGFRLILAQRFGTLACRQRNARLT
jgi:hypothetical protein